MCPENFSLDSVPYLSLPITDHSFFCGETAEGACLPVYVGRTCPVSANFSVYSVIYSDEYRSKPWWAVRGTREGERLSYVNVSPGVTHCKYALIEPAKAILELKLVQNSKKTNE